VLLALLLFSALLVSLGVPRRMLQFQQILQVGQQRLKPSFVPISGTAQALGPVAGAGTSGRNVDRRPQSLLELGLLGDGLELRDERGNEVPRVEPLERRDDGWVELPTGQALNLVDSVVECPGPLVRALVGQRVEACWDFSRAARNLRHCRGTEP
jgi:hypothetical protein